MSKRRGLPDFAAMPAAVLAAALVCAIFAPSPTASAVAAAKPLTIVAPVNGALVKGSSVRLEVSTGSSVSSFRVRLGNKDVTAAFHRDGQLRFATLHLGKALKRGANYLYVRARLASGREAFAFRRFVVVKRNRDLLSESSIARGSGAAPVVASTRSHPGGVVLEPALNGQPLSGTFVRRSGRHRAELGADDGLRFGRNHLRLLAYSGGRYDVVNQTFVIPRDRPIPGAGPNGQARRGAAIALSGKSSRAARKGANLSYRWKVVGAPKGAKPKLRGANTSTPSLRPNGSGTYRVRLTVSERPRGVVAFSARPAGDGAETASEQDVVTIAVQPDDPPIGARIETLTGAGKINIAGADVPNTGRGQLSYAVLDRATRAVLASDSAAASPAGLQAVETVLEKWQEPHYVVILSSNKGVDPAALPALQKLLTSLGASPLGPRDRRQILFSEGEPYAFSVIGYPDSPPGSAFVNVGRRQVPSARPGNIAGYLQLNPYALQPSSLAASEPESLYGYVNGGGPAFDTRAGGSGDSNTMVVAGRAIEAEMFDDVPEGSSGFHLVALDPSSLEPLSGGEDEFNQIFATNTGNLAADQATTHSLAETAQAVIAANNLLLLQSIGHPKPTTPAWSQLIEVVANAGGTPALIGGLDGSGGYAVIGSGGENQVQAIETAQSTTLHFAVLFRGIGTDTIFPTAGPARAIEQKLEQMSSIGSGNVNVTWDAPTKSWRVEFTGALGGREWPLMALSPDHPAKETAPASGLARAGGLPPGYPQAETSEKLTHRPARLAGFFARDHDFDYRPTLAGDSAIPGGGLVELAYSPGKPFPPFASPGEKAADAYIAKGLNFVDKSGVRANYYKDYEANWGVKLTTLATLCPSSFKGSPCEAQGFSEAEFSHVRTQLQHEIVMLTEVQGLIAHLQAPFDKNKTDAYVNLIDISQKISEGVQPPDVSTSVTSAGILSHMFSAAAGGLEGPAGTAASLLGEGLGKAGEQLRPNASPILSELQVKTSALSFEVLERYNEASASLSQLGLILVSDYGKMTAVSERVSDAWNWKTTSTANAQWALKKGTQRWFWTALLPVAYRLWQIGSPEVETGGVPKNAREYNCRNGGRYGMTPFQGNSDLVQNFGTVGIAPSGATVVPLKQLRALGEPSPNWDAKDPDVHPPTEALVKPLFEPLKTPQGLGLHVPEFISPRVFTLAPGRFSTLHYGKECGE